METRNLNLTTTLVMIFIAALLIGLVGGIIGAYFFARPGPEGPQGVQGTQGVQGIEGVQGQPGLNGTDAFLQAVQSQNATQIGVGTAYTLDRWYNMSVADNSMSMTMNVQDQSRIYAEFLTSVYLSDISSVHIRIVVDNQFNGTICMAELPTPSSVDLTFPAQAKIVTDALPAGQHTIDVQFLRVDGTPIILDRFFAVMELASP